MEKYPTFLQKIYAYKTIWLLEHIVFAGIPVYLAVVKYADNTIVHYVLMAGVILYMGIISWAMKASLKSLGFNSSNLKQAFAKILPGTILIAIIIVLSKYFGIVHIEAKSYLPMILLYVLVSVPLQELVFRSFCVWRCEISWKNQIFTTLFTSMNFAYYHLIFGDLTLVIGVFFLNLFWSYYYFKDRNIFATIISHALIGIIYFI